ncbi:MAG: exodeoxyribonuclease V subunit alpha [Shewanella sp.]|nr:exodeoxyribonuclease V subunit alpha [Shewanella sp.]MCF1429675.1 exodeoxyribonuclease V subunit alpha [Shewanella sp.]MCF1437427.1 exodeoxyribonuclease V subunit alpha [Shewanella sp.]MCF1456309.1 exodeoxyribonuclease V subunit alpha [Shewanella sp.]
MIHTTMPLESLLKQLEQERLLTPLDRHFALQMAHIHQLADDLFVVICALLSRQLSAQHACLPIDNITLDNPFGERTPSISIKADIQMLSNAIARFAAVGQDGDNTPLILDGNRLYLKRYFDFEKRVANRLMQAAAQRYTIKPDTALALQYLFADNGEHAIDWQKVATATSVCNQFAVITGGPGTGKTTTVTKLLMLLCLSADMTIRLVAPTGKAAARLSESIKASKQRLRTELAPYADKLDLRAIDAIPEEAATLHRLLGVIPGSPQFRHHSANPLHLDLLIVDEASMVDLPMMDRLLNALPTHARLILLGDQDQLASVEAGAVLADICAGLKTPDDWQMRYDEAFATALGRLTRTDLMPFVSPHPGIGNNLCMLRLSHRFKDDAGIGVLAKAVNQCDKAAIRAAWGGGFAELEWIDHGQQRQGLKQLLRQACESFRDYLEVVHRPDFSPEAIIERYNQYRILCATRAGESGVEGINARVTEALKQAGLINPASEFYPGRPVIIQNNDYNLGLFNGDIGIIFPCHESRRLMAHFIQADGSVLKVLPARLPGHETCFAMTVHKSQGSEFASVALVLPPTPSPAQWQLLTKELVYTAITRAKSHFSCLGSHRVFEGASMQRTQRASGLAERLWSDSD